jgi:hypothetical protein
MTGCRDKVIGAIAGFYKAIPDLKREIKELLIAGNKVTVRLELRLLRPDSGHSRRDFLGHEWQELVALRRCPKSLVTSQSDIETFERMRIGRAAVPLGSAASVISRMRRPNI